MEELIKEMNLKQINIEGDFIINKHQLKEFAEKYQALQLQQGGVMARFNISEDELIKELEDKRICKLSDLPEDVYYLHRKETARWLLEKYDVFKK